MTRYYDLVLGLIPLTLGGVAVLLTAAGFTLTTAIPLASAVAVVVIGHAMFVNGPVETGSGAATGTDGGVAHGGDARPDGAFQSAD